MNPHRRVDAAHASRPERRVVTVLAGKCRVGYEPPPLLVLAEDPSPRALPDRQNLDFRAVTYRLYRDEQPLLVSGRLVGNERFGEIVVPPGGQDIGHDRTVRNFLDRIALERDIQRPVKAQVEGRLDHQRWSGQLASE